MIVLPGLAANDASTIPLRWYLQRVGHHVEGWELGTHQPRVLSTLSRFSGSLRRAAERAGEPITLVGWSLGGIIAREAARDHPEQVAQVITLGSPINSPRRASTPSTGGLGERLISRAARRPIRAPMTSIYSRRDGVVDWRSSVDRSPNAENFEVTSSHIGLGVDPDVWRIVADAIDDRTSNSRR